MGSGTADVNIHLPFHREKKRERREQREGTVGGSQQDLRKEGFLEGP